MAQPTFNIKNFSTTSTHITNCTGQKVTVSLTITNTSTVEDTTEVTFFASGIVNATTIENYNLMGNDTFKKDPKTNYYTWKINEKCKERSMSFDVTYKNASKYPYVIKVVIDRNRGTDITRRADIYVDNCKPDFDFQILNEFKTPTNKFQYSNTEPFNNRTIYVQLTLHKNEILNHNESLQIDTDGLIFDNDDEWEFKVNDNIIDNPTISQVGNIYTFSDIANYDNISITRKIILNDTGVYNVTGQYINTTKSEWGNDKVYQIAITGDSFKKDYFKIRLEDGSDVKYNSLMFTKGDDLLQPLTYDIKQVDTYINQMIITGEKKRIPTNEIQYIHFNIDLPQENNNTLYNVLSYIDVESEEYDAHDIVVGTSKNMTLLSTDDTYVCSIDKITPGETTTVKIAVKSSVEIDNIIVKIKPFNIDGYNDNTQWTPCYVTFKDIPNIKISIQGTSELESNTDTFWLNYKIQNLSNIDGENVRFQLKEPHQFKKIDYVFNNENEGTWFNEHNRVITFTRLEANSAEKILSVKYEATKRGIFDFIIHTLDEAESIIDDQYQNSYTHSVMVNIPNDIRAITNVSNSMPHVGELIDFSIKVKNFHKKQETFKFDIFDSGNYDNIHDTNDYTIEYAKYEHGDFTVSNEGNKIGTWTLKNIDINDEYILILSIRPTNTNNHFIKTILTDQLNNVQNFYNEVKVLEPDKQLDFDVYHAVNENEDNDCPNCNDLIKICDDDFINLNDDIYYVFEIRNNNRNTIKNPLHVYARLPESFLTNNILCSSNKQMYHNKENNLISFEIPNLAGCNSPESIVKFCIKVRPAEAGRFVSNFSLSTKNAKVLYKQLKLTVDTEFNNRQLEHEIKIYNFTKTNKYYRYEIDNVGTIFKFFNTGDKTLRPIDIESFEKNAVETYRGTNLRDIVQQIKDNSQYVDPLFLREGSNKLANKGYELYPDGLIRRFGLLNSEVYHYSGQFPTTTNLVDRAMKWDVDTWDSKVWAGDPYDNGIFSLSIDYTKIPSNFDILNVDNPIKNLQNLVDNVKPYGTKAICHYSATIRANLQVNINNINNKIKYNNYAQLKLPNDFTTVSSYNRFDDTTAIYNDLPKYTLNTNIDSCVNKISYKKRKTTKDISPSINQIDSCIFADKISKIKTQDCYDIISNIYNTNLQARNIDITKPIPTYTNDSQLPNIKTIEFNNTLQDDEYIGFKITPSINTQINVLENINVDNNSIYCVYVKDDKNNFTGFKFIIDNKIIQERNISQDINHINIQVQICSNNDENILHFWGSINNDEYYHIGLCVLNNIDIPQYEVYKNIKEIQYTTHNVPLENDTSLTFKISDKTQEIKQQPNYIKAIENNKKWEYLKNINKDNKYAYFENNINVDKACTSRKINIPKIITKYNNIDIDDLDEIVDIQFKIDAHSNKNNFEKDININLYKDGDKYIPENNIAREIIYPSAINNINQSLITTFELEQENITICSHCLKTSLGYHDICPYCGSSHVQYSNEKTNATICYNCGWIHKGWDDYCHNCLSYDVEKTLIDYNKTYCENCGTVSPDYYEHCPQCFSSKVVHLTNNINKYKIFGEDRQNIKPININIDDQQVKIFSLHIPLRKDTAEIKNLEYLTLKVHGINNNDGKYYHCLACGSAHIGNYDKCPYCNSKLINNYQVNNDDLKIFFKSGNTYISYSDLINNNNSYQNIQDLQIYDSHINGGNFVKEIDLLKCIQHNSRDKFQLIFYIENQSYEENINNILQLPVKDEYKAQILDAISPINIEINNLSLDYKYKDENEWVHLDKLQHDNHTGISYKMPKDTTTTDAIIFENFDINGKYKKASLCINGIVKNVSDNIKMHVKIHNNNHIYELHEPIYDILFSYNYNIIDTIGEYIKDLSVEVYFSNIKTGEIIITDCNVTIEYDKYDNTFDDGSNTSPIITKIDNIYLIRSDNLWGLKDTPPYYLSGKQLTTNLVAYIDFGTLDLQEYIRLYNIEAIIYYKSKTGHIVTATVSPSNSQETIKVILQGAGYSSTKIQNIINNGTSLTTALAQKNKHMNNEYIKELLSGKITRNDGLLWGSINYSNEGLNNLESEITNINEDDVLVNDIPLYYKIAQSFNTSDSINSISKIYIDYFNKRGYPNQNINVYLCKDKNGQPGKVIASNIAHIDKINEVLNIDLNVENLQSHTDYWIVLEDTSADKNNHHRFYYNNNNSIGQLITYTDKNIKYENCVLRFGIDKIKRDRTFYKLPKTWYFYDEFDGYKIHNTLYRYNIQDNSNVLLSNFMIKHGYNLRDGGE